MKLKILQFIAEYFVFVGAFVVLVLVARQDGVYDSVKMIVVLGITIILLWFFGAALKCIIRKERPSGRLSNMIVRDKYTFPSMHALTLSSASYYVLIHNITLGVIMIGVTVLVLIARVKTRMHYISDMIAGSVLGIVFTYFAIPCIEKYVSMFYFL
jgi:membrane-associated phospholipid phosphatase